MGEGTALGRARGLGSAHHGSHHWLLQRFTAAGNLLTVGYLVFSFLLLTDYSFDNVRLWLAQPLPVLALALMIVSVFWHARLGLQVMIEDYVHGAARFATILVLNLVTFAGAAAGLLFLMLILIGAQTDSAVAASQAQMSQMMGGGQM